MKTQTITFTFNLNSDPERDAEITVTYDFYRGNPLDAGDPCELDIISAVDESGMDVPIEEIQSKAEAEIWQSYKESREDQIYDSRREL